MAINISSAAKKVAYFVDNTIEEIIIIVLLALLVISLTFTVVVRYAFPALSMASHWAEELAVFSFVWLLYWGASLATRTGKHFRVTAQFNLLPTKMKKYAFLPGNIAWFLFNLLIIKFGWDLVEYSMESSLSLEIQMKYVYSIIPLSFSFITFRLIQNTIRTIRSAKE
jgi:TRAP-type C4-dicarboxylate transport system permease small subunit